MSVAQGVQQYYPTVYASPLYQKPVTQSRIEDTAQALADAQAIQKAVVSSVTQAGDHEFHEGVANADLVPYLADMRQRMHEFSNRMVDRLLHIFEREGEQFSQPKVKDLVAAYSRMGEQAVQKTFLRVMSTSLEGYSLDTEAPAPDYLLRWATRAGVQMPDLVTGPIPAYVDAEHRQKWPYGTADTPWLADPDQPPPPPQPEVPTPPQPKVPTPPSEPKVPTPPQPKPQPPVVPSAPTVPSPTPRVPDPVQQTQLRQTSLRLQQASVNPAVVATLPPAERSIASIVQSLRGRRIAGTVYFGDLAIEL